MQNMLSKVILLCLLLACFFIVADSLSEDAIPPDPISEETEICLDCHNHYTPGIVEDWRRSRHAKVAPMNALKKPEAQRRVSASDFADAIGNVSVGCYECHSLNPDKHVDNFEHAGMDINVIVTPNDCKTCHPVEADQYMGSKKAHAVDNLRKNPVYHTLVEATIGLKEARDGNMVRLQASDFTEQETCYACHGTEVKLERTKTISTDIGDMDIPVLSNWPNQGVGRINPDGSMGACTACHPRHGFHIEVARKPYTCSQCHLEPDVPAWNVYKESKHGNIYFSMNHHWEWNAVPWKLGEDFSAPTCSVCHNSHIISSEGRTVVQRSHDFGDRLWVRIFGLIYSHAQPKSGETYRIKNKDGLPLPVAFDGTPASEYLIDEEEQEKRRDMMENLCKFCHTSTWVDGHFAKMDNTLNETDKMVAAATHIVNEAWSDGLADNSNPFDEAIEIKWVRQWLFYANSVRYASAMTGAPDYATFKNGWWEMTSNLQEMQSLMALKTDSEEHPPEAVAEAVDRTKKPEKSTPGSFENIDLAELSILSKQYLGLGDDINPILGNVNADIIIVEFMSVYCPSCQKQAPIFNELYAAIEADPDLKAKVKMMGIGVGNNSREVDNFVKNREVKFPIIPDPKFTIYEQLADSMRTPYTVMLKRDGKGKLIPVDSHMGLIDSYRSYLTEIKSAIQQGEGTVSWEYGAEIDPSEYTKLKLPSKELVKRVKESMVRASGDEDIEIELKFMSLREEPEIYERSGGKTKYFSVVVNRESVCDICHAIQFIYTFDEMGKIVDFEPVYLTKWGNKEWNEKDIEKLRERVVGKSILQPLNFDPEVDAVTSATITSAVIFKAISDGRDIYREVIK